MMHGTINIKEMKALSPLCAECPEIWEPHIPGNTQGLSRRVPGLLYLLHQYGWIFMSSGMLHHIECSIIASGSEDRISPSWEAVCFLKTSEITEQSTKCSITEV